MNNMILAINASRARSGGAITHLSGILASGISPVQYGFEEVHVWGYASLLDALPDEPWLIKHNPPVLERSLPWQVWWERFSLPGELRRTNCSILLNVDAGTIARFRPAITMSRDMLSYEPGEIERFGISNARLRLILLRYLQNRSLQFADGVIFLTQYAAKVIQDSCGFLPRTAHIPHGVSYSFLNIQHRSKWPKLGERPIHCLYISSTALYKHQWMVVRAVEILRNKKIDITLTLVGGGSGAAKKKLERQITMSDPKGEFVTEKEFVPHLMLLDYLADADIFIFASSCENMPNTLVEAMAAGLPIACSDRGPMPEVLADAGVYFDPENPISIAEAIQKLIDDSLLREKLASKAKLLSQQYSWSRCAKETWTFISEIGQTNGKADIIPNMH